MTCRQDQIAAAVLARRRQTAIFLNPRHLRAESASMIQLDDTPLCRLGNEAALSSDVEAMPACAALSGGGRMGHDMR